MLFIYYTNNKLAEAFRPNEVFPLKDSEFILMETSASEFSRLIEHGLENCRFTAVNVSGASELKLTSTYEALLFAWKVRPRVLLSNCLSDLSLVYAPSMSSKETCMYVCKHTCKYTHTDTRIKN